ncbi:diaminopimelate epimerase [Abyssibius alkaniclasticus]|uniref:diaminopimelate epimerase n=1 Tax=Abyssibius alkaniclasticus TaxID=2881234 RepID=UPI002363E289|nr:diaminopimelate epimerase [Abyssibius alkaniclasticus]UPH72597.1 diaminopimelate epimerase [Abyssibius alkaniclasticus]
MNMGQKSALRFAKMHGLGNDFVVVDARRSSATITPALARALGDRHRGVGFDQLAVIRNGAGVAAEVDFWNSDGSTAGACGNATRCVAQMLLAESSAESLTLRTERGDLACALAPGGLVRVNMGAPVLHWADIPLAQDVDLNALPLAGRAGTAGMGNPHCVFIVADADAVDLAVEGPKYEHHPLFPARTNVAFVQVIDRSNLRMRVWERGGMVTLACGSGACAAAVVAHRMGLAEACVDIQLDGGTLNIDWREDGVWMTGPTAHVFDGILTPEMMALA